MRLILSKIKNFKYRLTGEKIEEGYEESINFHYQEEWSTEEDKVIFFFSIEKNDTVEKILKVFEKAEKFIEKYPSLENLKIILFRFAHLSINLMSAVKAKGIILELRKKTNYFIIRFGWHKEYSGTTNQDIHYFETDYPENSVRAKLEYSLKVKQKGERLLDVDEQKIDSYKEELKLIINTEFYKKGMKKSISSLTKENIKKLNIKWAPNSEKGHLRLIGEGQEIYERICSEMKKETLILKENFKILPHSSGIFLNLDHSIQRKQYELFSDRLYTLPRENQFLRYAACHGHLASFKEIEFLEEEALGLFELAQSYRQEQTGELVPLYRHRSFIIPDLHTLVKKNYELKVFLIQVERILEFAKKYSIELYRLISFADEEKYDAYKNIIDKFDNCVIQVLKGTKFYWAFNIEFFFIDSNGVARELSTVQLDLDSPKAFGIRKGETYSLIHFSICGSIERFYFYLIDKFGTKKGLRVNIFPYINILTTGEIDSELKKEIYGALSNKMILGEEKNLTLSKKIKQSYLSSFSRYFMILGSRDKGDYEIVNKENSHKERIDIDKIKNLFC